MEAPLPPSFDWQKAIRGKAITLPIGIMTEYSFTGGTAGSTAIAQLNGDYPCFEDGKKWARNTQVDEWYIMFRGQAEVTLEGQAPRKLKAGKWMYRPKGAWLKSTFKNAVLEIPTIPMWTHEQCEYK